MTRSAFAPGMSASRQMLARDAEAGAADPTDFTPTCLSCQYFNGMNGRDLCLWHTAADNVRGTRVLPRTAAYERSRWVLMPGGERCKPEGRHWEAWPYLRPPLPPADCD